MILDDALNTLFLNDISALELNILVWPEKWEVNTRTEKENRNLESVPVGGTVFSFVDQETAIGKW